LDQQPLIKLLINGMCKENTISKKIFITFRLPNPPHLSRGISAWKTSYFHRFFPVYLSPVGIPDRSRNRSLLLLFLLLLVALRSDPEDNSEGVARGFSEVYISEPPRNPLASPSEPSRNLEQSRNKKRRNRMNGYRPDRGTHSQA